MNPALAGLALCLLAPAALASRSSTPLAVPNVVWVYLEVYLEQLDAQPCGPAPFALEVEVGANNLTGVDVLLPDGTLISLAQDAPGEPWYGGTPGCSLAAPPVGDCSITFHSTAGSDSVTVPVGNDPFPPTPQILSPAMSETGVSLLPVLHWSPVPEPGIGLYAIVGETSSDEEAAAGDVDSAATCWRSSALLDEFTEHYFGLEAYRETVTVTATVGGDVFEFVESCQNSNNVLFTTGSAGSIFAPVPAAVTNSGGTTVIADIGTLQASPTSAGGMQARFELSPAYSYLDACYDFRWVQVISQYFTAEGPRPVLPNQKPLPILDPWVGATTSGACGSPSCTADAEPFWHDDQEWAVNVSCFGWSAIHSEYDFTSMHDGPKLCSDPMCDPGAPDCLLGDVAVFRTWLVAEDVIAASLGAKSFHVLLGFEWAHSYGWQHGEAFVGDPLPATSGPTGICGVPGNDGLNTALGNGGYVGWSPVVGAALSPCIPFVGQPGQLSLSIGGSQALTLAAGSGSANAPYLILGSLSGTAPGLAADGLVLPLNPDAYLLWTLTHPNSPTLTKSFGLLDAGGAASGGIAFHLPLGLDPALAGESVHHAYAVLDLVTYPGVPVVSFVSNAVTAQLVF